MNQLFVNGPIQNGNFTFGEMPGRATSLQIVETFNGLATGQTAPHLWNTVTLDGDKRYAAEGNGADRRSYEHKRIQQKYQGLSMNGASIMTDADPKVAELALEMIEDGLSTGQLTLSEETVSICKGCEHMVGTASACKACGGESLDSRREKHLVFERDPSKPVLTREDTYGQSDPRYLATIAGHVPDRLILSKTRSYGVDLGAIGLNSLVLDPRAGLHVTCLAAGKDLEADITSMVVTEKAARGLIAYGVPFRRTGDQTLTYALHGYVPSSAIEAVTQGAPVGQEELSGIFANWYMPLNSMASRNEIPDGQVPALFKFFGKIFRTQQSPEVRANYLEEIRGQIAQGKLRWLTDKAMLAAAMPRDNSSS